MATAFEESSDDEFRNWLWTEFQDAPNRVTYSDVYEDAIEAIICWRKRYRGNPALWKRIFKKDKIVKELIESVPIIQSVKDIIMADDSNQKVNTDTIEEKYTIIDLCSGKGYLSMLLSEILPPEKVRKCLLVDKVFAIATEELKPHHINWDHIYGEVVAGTDQTYFTTWPIPLHTSKQDLKKTSNPRKMKQHIFDKHPGPIILLAVHLCGTLSLKAIDMFNQNEQVEYLALKPCCLPGMVYAKRKQFFQIGTHCFPSAEVCSHGYFRGNDWNGPRREHLESKFHKWAHHLFQGIDIGDVSSKEQDDDKATILNSPNGTKSKREIAIQVDGGYQNTFLFATRIPEVKHS